MAPSTNCPPLPRSLVVAMEVLTPNSQRVRAFPQSVEPQRWPKSKTTPTDISEISTIESEESNGILRQAVLRALTQLDVEITPSPKAIAHLIKMHKETAGIHTRIRQRIELLKEIGEEEEIAYNANSEQDLWRFLKRLSFIKSPKLFLLDNGNLRAVWKGDGGKHIGLQFPGGEQIQFVITELHPTATEQVATN